MEIDIKELVIVLKSLAEEKNLDEDTVQDIIEQALATTWRRSQDEGLKEVRAKLNLKQGLVDIYTSHEVVEEISDPCNQILLAEAQKLQPNIALGQMLEKPHSFKNLGRVAAQTAKQVILQKLRETEREMVLDEYKNKIGTIMSVTISKVDPKIIRCDVGRIRGIMPASEQIPGENYLVGHRLRVLLKEINRTGREPQLILNRGGVLFLRLLFEKEVPEIENGAVEIEAIVREAGARSKVAVVSKVPNVDPVGTLIGGQGTRVQAVNAEIGSNEKIDIVVWDEDPKQNIINALSSSDIISVTILEEPSEDKLGKARVIVPKEQLSVTIGRSGQNVRLAGQLTGYNIDVVDEVSATAPKTVSHTLQRKEQLEENLLKAVEEVQEEETEVEPGNQQQAAT